MSFIHIIKKNYFLVVVSSSPGRETAEKGENKAMLGKKQGIVRSVLLITAILIVGAAYGRIIRVKPDCSAAAEGFGYHALKINGKYVGEAVFREEQNKFFLRWRRNAGMLRKNDEERNDLLLEEIINRVALEEYLLNRSGVKISPREVERYLNRYVRSKYATSSEFQNYLDIMGCADAKALQKEIQLYLLRLKCLPPIARKYGVGATQAEIDERYAKQREENGDYAHPRREIAAMLRMEQFMKSEQFSVWLDRVKSQMEIVILDPAFNAYRCFKNQKYETAGRLYEEIYRHRQQEFYLRRALESYRLAKNWDKVFELSKLESEGRI
jgi:hypothetical protein